MKICSASGKTGSAAMPPRFWFSYAHYMNSSFLNIPRLHLVVTREAIPSDSIRNNRKGRFSSLLANSAWSLNFAVISLDTPHVTCQLTVNSARKRLNVYIWLSFRLSLPLIWGLGINWEFLNFMFIFFPSPFVIGRDAAIKIKTHKAISDKRKLSS